MERGHQVARAVPFSLPLLAAVLVSACSSAVQYSDASVTTAILADSFGGSHIGFDVAKLDSETWQVTFEGNTWTTEGTAQTYGLYRCAVIALQNGYDGFEIRSDIRFDDFQKTYEDLPGASNPFFPYGPAPYALFTGGGTAFPVFSSEIKLLKKPFAGQPPKVFDAATLKAALEPYVMGKKCEKGNVCAHERDYLRPNQQ